MRELHDHHGEYRRHAHDAAAEIHAPLAHDGPKHAAHDALKLRMLTDPAFRMATRLKHQEKVETAEAEYAGKHAKPKPGNQARVLEQLRPQEAKSEHAPPGTRDRPASKIADRRDPLENQKEERRRPERIRLPSNEMAQAVAGIGVTLSSVANAVNVLPGRWDAVAASFLGAVVAGVAWGNRRWKERHGH